MMQAPEVSLSKVLGLDAGRIAGMGYTFSGGAFGSWE